MKRFLIVGLMMSAICMAGCNDKDTIVESNVTTVEDLSESEDSQSPDNAREVEASLYGEAQAEVLREEFGFDREMARRMGAALESFSIDASSIGEVSEDGDGGYFIRNADMRDWYFVNISPKEDDPNIYKVNEKITEEDIEGFTKCFMSGKSNAYVSTPVLADVTGDGINDLCAIKTSGSGIVRSVVVAYDYANTIDYSLTRKDVGNYSIDGVVRKKLAVTRSSIEFDNQGNPITQEHHGTVAVQNGDLNFVEK